MPDNNINPYESPLNICEQYVQERFSKYNLLEMFLEGTVPGYAWYNCRKWD